MGKRKEKAEIMEMCLVEYWIVVSEREVLVRNWE